MLQEFRQSAMHGSVVDRATGIIGSGSGTIVRRLMSDTGLPRFGPLLLRQLPEPGTDS